MPTHSVATNTGNNGVISGQRIPIAPPTHINVLSKCARRAVTLAAIEIALAAQYRPECQIVP
ncbi:MAG: hypothetical protein ACJAWY_000749 [Sphingomonas echinoides]|jgi:hypothetical protein